VFLGLIALWLASRGANRNPEQAFAWLNEHGARTAIEQALRPVMERLWAESWAAGEKAAESLSGPHEGIFAGTGHFPESEGRKWLNQIIQHLLEDLADAFAEAEDAADLRSRVTDLLTSATRAERIATTEVTRAMQVAAANHYRLTGVHSVRWLTLGPNPCPLCTANRNAGAHPIGIPFPSGAIAPPQHPNCRCALIPA
jgi:hypothetical protein